MTVVARDVMTVVKGAGGERAEPMPLPRWARRVLEGTREATARELIGGAASCTLPKGARLCHDTDPGAAVFFVESGTARLCVHGPDRWSGIALLGPGDPVGELVHAYGAGRPASVTCLETVNLACVARSSFDAAARIDPRFAANVARLRNAAVKATQASFASLRWLEVDRRVARGLLALAECYGVREPDGRVRIPLRLTQGDLAVLACASRERTNRALNAFRQRGWLVMDRGHRVTLARPDLLRKRLYRRLGDAPAPPAARVTAAGAR